ncbi:NUDIX domain-containing protein [Paracoccus sp. PAR01]|uniref:NUDIX domain-containing protein n=1 Tax=Paracoccus sp. PAR01 TaxID=2769282 RepID=UPI00177ECC13|nr:NUDIX domain-containing protein [Paracoccus sp. PAR01]MBD9525314.1 NUDIX domain-containing protein [Paracoccus sp. PAR01]
MNLPPIRDAATVIVLDRDTPQGPAVLMGQRGATAAFMPSKYVFPGGAVDPGDAAARLSKPLAAEQRRLLALDPIGEHPDLPEALAAAALRELAEETGLIAGLPGDAPQGWPLHAARGLAPDPSALIYVFRAVTPPRNTRRFDARFLLLDADRLEGDRNDFSAACDELSHLHWVPLTEARALDLPFITEVVLAEIAAIAARPGPLRGPERVPFFDNRGEVPRFSWLS